MNKIYRVVFNKVLGVWQGRIDLGHGQALGTGALAMDDGTTLGFSAQGLTIANANAIRMTGTNDPTFDTGAYSAMPTGGISGGADLTKEGSGTEASLGAHWQVNPRVDVYGELGQMWAACGSARTAGCPNASVGVKLRW